MRTGQILAQVARDDRPTRSANCPAPAQPWRKFQIKIGARPITRQSSIIVQKPGRSSCRRFVLLVKRKRPTDAGNAKNEYFAHTPSAPIKPATVQARGLSERRPRYVQTAAQVQQHTKGVSLVITTPPIARIGIAGSNTTDNIAARRCPVVSDARRNTPQAVSPPRRTAGSRAATICDPVSLTLIPPSNSVARRITQAIKGPRE